MGLPASQQRILEQIEQTLREDAQLEMVFEEFASAAGGPALPPAERLASWGWTAGAADSIRARGGWFSRRARCRGWLRSTRRRRTRRLRSGPGGSRRLALLLGLAPAVALSLASLLLLSLPLPQRACALPGCPPGRTAVSTRIRGTGAAARRRPRPGGHASRRVPGTARRAHPRGAGGRAARPGPPVGAP